MQAVARRADVAAGTVLYHFDDPDALLAAVVAQKLQRLSLPRPGALPERSSRTARVHGLVEALHAFYERSARDYPLFLRNRDHPAVQAGLAEFTAAVRALTDRALEGWPGSNPARAAFDAVCDVGFYVTLTGRGLTSAEATEVASRLAVCALSQDVDPPTDRSSP